MTKQSFLSHSTKIINWTAHSHYFHMQTSEFLILILKIDYRYFRLCPFCALSDKEPLEVFSFEVFLVLLIRLVDH
jgi:hypothetical protein